MNNERSKESLFHVTDLTTYEEAVTAYKNYLAKHVSSKEDAERLLQEFDEVQKHLWSDHTIEKSEKM